MRRQCVNRINAFLCITCLTNNSSSNNRSLLYTSKRTFFDHKTQPPPFQDHGTIRKQQQQNKGLARDQQQQQQDLSQQHGEDVLLNEKLSENQQKEQKNENSSAVRSSSEFPTSHWKKQDAPREGETSPHEARGSSFGTQESRGAILPPRTPTPFTTKPPSNNNNNNNNLNKNDHSSLAPETSNNDDEDHNNFLKIIQREIEDEQYRLDKEEPPAPSSSSDSAQWEAVHHVEGSSWWSISRTWRPAPLERLSSSTDPESSLSASQPSSEPAKEQKVDTTINSGTSNEIELPSWLKALHAFQDGVEERHIVRVRLTSRDPSKDPECDIRGEHNPFSITILRRYINNNNSNSGEDNTETQTHKSMASASSWYQLPVVHLLCDVVEGELVVDNIRVFQPEQAIEMFEQSPLLLSPQQNNEHKNNPNLNQNTRRELMSVSPNAPPVELLWDPTAVAAYEASSHYYPGPNLNECEESFLDALQVWMGDRSLDDTFAESLGLRSVWVEQMEYERWLKQLKSFVAA